MRTTALDRLIVALGFVGVAICDREAHQLLGLSVWRANLICELPVDVDEVTQATRPISRNEPRSSEAARC